MLVYLADEPGRRKDLPLENLDFNYLLVIG